MVYTLANFRAEPMSKNLANKLVVAISSSALFNLDESNKIYEQEGIDAYADYQITHENEELKPGIAMPLVQKFLQLNTQEELVEVILLSRNSADTGHVVSGPPRCGHLRGQSPLYQRDGRHNRRRPGPGGGRGGRRWCDGVDVC